MELTTYEKEIQNKCARLAYEELIEVAQNHPLPIQTFIIAQPELLIEFKKFLVELGIEKYDEKTAALFMTYQKEKLTNT